MNENDFYIAGDNLPELLPNDQLYELLDRAKKGIEEINFKKQEKLDKNKHDFDTSKLK